MGKLLRERIAWSHPEWWALAISGTAWVWIAFPAAMAALGGVHDHSSASPGGGGPAGMIPATREWAVMVMAMMLPLATGPIRAIAARSLWRRRHRAIACWLFGYIAAWMVLGLFVSLVHTRFLADVHPSPRAGVAVAFAVAAIWQAMSARQRAIRACHRTPSLAPAGWRANRDCVRYGWTNGMNCVATCGALMLACWLVGHGAAGLLVMITATAVGFAERFMVRPNQRTLAIAVGAHAIFAAAILPGR